MTKRIYKKVTLPRGYYARKSSIARREKDMYGLPVVQYFFSCCRALHTICYSAIHSVCNPTMIGDAGLHYKHMVCLFFLGGAFCRLIWSCPQMTQFGAL